MQRRAMEFCRPHKPSREDGSWVGWSFVGVRSVCVGDFGSDRRPQSPKFPSRTPPSTSTIYLVFFSPLRPLFLVGPGFQKVKRKARSRVSSSEGGGARGAAAATEEESESWAEFRHPQFRRGRRDLLAGITRQKDSGRLKRKQGARLVSCRMHLHSPPPPKKRCLA